jgi:hypothetical protein
LKFLSVWLPNYTVSLTNSPVHDIGEYVLLGPNAAKRTLPSTFEVAAVDEVALLYEPGCVIRHGVLAESQ